MHNLLSDMHHDSWDAYALPQERYYLSSTDEGGRDGKIISGRPLPGWTRSIETTPGFDTEAFVAEKLVQTGLRERLGNPWIYKTDVIARQHALVWNTEPLESAKRVQGELEIRLTVTPQATSCLIVAYLFDYDPVAGDAAIITNAPYTLENTPPGQPRTVTFPMQPAHYVLRRGHQLQLIIDTHDTFFADANADETLVEISSPEGCESYIAVPLHDLSPPD
ncbi:hypothetical protein E1258_19175 [Micromonospora sp. KC207]|uniref:CocE/NonD family hydrolase C-terminal non-catalytic domain-containing protein n=1 Tax=Micromonospora sp. KC207 TaxID=2530377 RepID=UPI001048C63F|nr:CocE/NonD family hydrolase C-terminal non-catalytic domain-containing protein [Micromonospora sp. KC207]TDC59107.1 hypothetical protein E1258_19175 [Micromonospora sp. KC207]